MASIDITKVFKNFLFKYCIINEYNIYFYR